MRRHEYLFALFTSFILVFGTAQAGTIHHLKELGDMQALGQKSKETDLPIMLLFGAEWCEYCELLVELVFDPMVLGGLYDGKVVHMRHVGVDQDEPVKDWNGNLINKAKFAYNLDADLTPTVLFLDGSGNEIAPRIIGIQEVTMFTNVIHRSLNIAYQTMGSTMRIPVNVDLLEKQSRNQPK